MLTKLQKAFPDFDNTLLFTNVLQKLRPLGFKDFSDKNEELPCIWLRNDNETKISIYINHDENPLPYELNNTVYKDIELMLESENYETTFVQKAFSTLESDDLFELCKSHLEG